jgi:hypothetical protein
MKSLAPSLVLVLAALGAGTAEAHVSVSSGPAKANATNEVTFGVGHGCGTSDTLAVQVEIPAGITSVRALTSDFGKPNVVKDGGGAVTSVTWTKPLADLQDSDVGYYQLRLRLRTPNTPFTKVYFLVHQTCRAMDGTETVVHWTALPGEEGEDAAALTILGATRYNGWNQFTLPAGMPALVAADLPGWFGDAQIVWKGSEAYSPNAAVTALIGTTPGVSAMTGLAAGETIWVKYYPCAGCCAARCWRSVPAATT